MMGDRRIIRRIGLLTAASVLALALVAVPAAPDFTSLDFKGQAAAAKGNGGGGGGGNSGHGGGHGGGNSGHGGADSGTGTGTDSDGDDDDDTASTDGSGKGHGKAGAPGQSKHGTSGVAATGNLKDDSTKHGATASMMGSLNSWTHASANARANASANSQVGLAASYEQAVLDGDITEAVESLLEAANKEVTDLTQAQAVVQSINAALDISIAETTEDPEVTEDPELTETTVEIAVAEDPALTEATETVQSRTISQATEDAVVAGFLAGDPTLGETEDNGTTDGSETTTDGSETTAEGDGDDGTGTDDTADASGTDGGTVTTPSS